MEEMRLRYLPRIEAAGEGADFALGRFGRVYAPLEVTRCEVLEQEIRGFLKDADVEGYCVAFLGSGHNPLDGLVVIGDQRPDAALLERAGPALLGLASLCARHAPPSLAGLTPREQEIAVLLADGLSKLNIASRLEIAEQTVVVHARSIYRKLGVHNRVDLAHRVVGASPRA
jgi:DNA-binding CsgD family transcriptional regulator